MNAFARRALAAARRRIALVAVVFVVLAAGGVAFLAAQPTSYTATSIVSFQPRQDQLAGADLVELLTARYPAIAESTPVVGAAASAAGVSTSTLRAGLSAAVTASTLNLTLATTLDDPARAIAANQSIYQALVSSSTRDIYLQALEVEQPTQVSQDPALPLPLMMLVVVLLAAVVAALVGLLADQLMTRRT
jgi:capsular polysaccharide biosynthesis protein